MAGEKIFQAKADGFRLPFKAVKREITGHRKKVGELLLVTIFAQANRLILRAFIMRQCIIDPELINL